MPTNFGSKSMISRSLTVAPLYRKKNTKILTLKQIEVKHKIKHE